MREKQVQSGDEQFRLEQETRRIGQRTGVQEKELDKVREVTDRLREQVADIERNKSDAEVVNKDIRRQTQDMEELKMDVENHGNHFAMVENFVEKYIPIRIQSTISEVLSYILPIPERNKLSEFEKRRF